MVFLEAALAAVRRRVSARWRRGISGRDGHTGLLAPEGDIERLAQQIERVLRDPALAHLLGKNGRARVEEQFDVRARAPPNLRMSTVNSPKLTAGETRRWRRNA